MSSREADSGLRSGAERVGRSRKRLDSARSADRDAGALRALYASPPGGGQTRYWMSKFEVMAPAPSQTVLLQAWE